ncbi:MAG TPA: gephyrin-like molybdotransferase Glp [Candidatus Sulfotelmatobacter sp.]
MPQTQASVLTFEDARRVVEEQASQIAPPPSETVDLLSAVNRILSETITADRDIPPFPRATRDGYAVRSTDVAGVPTTLRVLGEIKAGAFDEDQSNVGVGEAFAIMTGAPVPRGADAVVMVEYTTTQGEYVEIQKAIEARENIVAQGAEARMSSVLLSPGTRLNETSIALAASVGKSRLDVFKRPRVAVLTTGDEIVDINVQPDPAQIRNSNSYSLAAQIQQAGAEPVVLPIAPDEPRHLRELIEQGLQSDLLLMTGGVSMGRYDLVEQVLTEAEAEFFFTGAKIQPGRPVVFGRCKGSCGADTPFEPRAGSARKIPPPKYFFGLPGNPISTIVTFELFARPILEALSGLPPQPLTFLHARLKSAIHIKPGLRRFLPARLSGQYEDSQVELIPWQGSGDIAARARSNCLVVIPPHREHVPAGDWIAVMPH